MPDDVTLGRRTGVTDQYLRVWRLLIFNAQAQSSLLQGVAQQVGGLTGFTAASSDVSIFTSELPTGMEPGLETYAAGLRIHFNVTVGTNQTPNTAEITLYNVADNTANNLIQEFNYVVLQAGYEWGQAGTIFTGTIKYFKKGHESATDSYLKIYAADGDPAINGATINVTNRAGTSPRQMVDGLAQTFAQHGVTVGEVEDKALIQVPAIRDEVRMGMTSDQFRDLAQANGAIWYVYDQRFYWALPSSYDLGSTVVQLTAQTGLIGFPEITENGLDLTCLINPAIRLRQRIHLDNNLINQYFVPGGASGVGGTGQEAVMMGFATAPVQLYPVNADGYWVALHIQYEGDSRGGPWYMHCTCLGLNPSEDDVLKMLLGFDWNFLS